MKKILMILLCCTLMIGCGNKSPEEPREDFGEQQEADIDGTEETEQNGNKDFHESDVFDDYKKSIMEIVKDLEVSEENSDTHFEVVVKTIKEMAKLKPEEIETDDMYAIFIQAAGYLCNNFENGTDYRKAGDLAFEMAEYIARSDESGKQKIIDEFEKMAQERGWEIMTLAEEEQSGEPQEIVLLNSGWSCTKPYDYSTVYYAVEIENPNEYYAVEFPTIIITARDANGKILANEERVLSSIAAGDTIIYGSDMSYEGEMPDTVEISVYSNEDDCKKQDGNRYVKQSEFVISNTSENEGRHKKYTGEITNNSAVDFDKVSISVIYKLNGEIVGGENSYVNDLRSGGTKVFEISASSDVGEYDSYEFYAIQW